MASLSIADLLTVGGASIIVVLLVEIIKRTFALSKEWSARFGPLLAAGLGVIVAGSASLYLGAEVAQAVLTGFLAGCAAGGIYDIANSATKITSTPSG